MQIVIDIPQKVYDEALSGDGTGAIWAGYVKNGTPLPKWHGNLVDISELMDMLCLEDNAYNRDNNIAEPITLEDIDRLDVIIPEDKEEEE